MHRALNELSGYIYTFKYQKTLIACFLNLQKLLVYPSSSDRLDLQTFSAHELLIFS